MSEHNTTVKTSKDGTKVRAQCSCGWKGRPQDADHAGWAQMDASLHRSKPELHKGSR
jgi:hypothetical protein